MIQLHLNLTISARSLIFVFLIGVALFAGTDVARGAPSSADLTLDGNLVFTGPNQGGAKDIRTSNTDGGLRMYNGTDLSPVPTGAAIQFFGNGSNSYPGQAFIDSGAHDNAALIFRTAGTGQGITERMRVTAAGNVGIGTNNPQDQLELTGNLRLPPTTATTGIIRSGSLTLLHTFGTSNFFAGPNAGNLTMTGGFNTATGNSALQNNTTGGFNTAVGEFAMFNNTTGGFNTAVGRVALMSNTTGFGNVAVGGQAGLNNTTGSNNTFIGTQADAAFGLNNLTNATAIGANASVTQSNSLVLGGTGGNAVSVGIGTQTPISTLQVVGNYIQVPVVTATPPAADCDDVSEAGRFVVGTDATTTVFFVCKDIDASGTVAMSWVPVS